MKGLSFLFLLICAISCKKENVKSTKDGVDPNKIYGKWTWVSSTGGIAGMTITPKTAGFTGSAEFKRDQSARFYRNDTLVRTATFNITQGQTILSVEAAYLIKYKPDDTEQVIIKATKDTLILADNFNDGFSITYVKRK